ncbi:unnamed protein product [Diamesa serratosioi]
MNINCVICSDLFIAADPIYTTPCGHIFHHPCLLQWLEKSKTCPQCRFKCNQKTIHRVYFNQISNLDSTDCSATLQEKLDNMQLSIREKDNAIKSRDEVCEKLKTDLKIINKDNKTMKIYTSQKNQIIATMKHEIDLLSSHKQTFKALEQENQTLKTKLNFMHTIESVLTSSQKDIEETLEQQLNVKDLSTMVGVLKRELKNNELRKNEFRKQLQHVKSDLRTEQDLKRKLQEKLDYYESENHRLSNKCEKLTKINSIETIDVSDDSSAGQNGTPDGIKKSRFALHNLDGCQNTPSPLSTKEFNERVTKIQDSSSPYMKVKASSIALAGIGLFKKPSDSGFSNLLKRPGPISNGVKDQSTLSIFKKPRLNTALKMTSINPQQSCYNGMGSSDKVLQSDLKTFDSTWNTSAPKKIKKLSPLALN